MSTYCVFNYHYNTLFRTNFQIPKYSRFLSRLWRVPLNHLPNLTDVNCIARKLVSRRKKFACICHKSDKGPLAGKNGVANICNRDVTKSLQIGCQPQKSAIRRFAAMAANAIWNQRQHHHLFAAIDWHEDIFIWCHLSIYKKKIYDPFSVPEADCPNPDFSERQEMIVVHRFEGTYRYWLGLQGKWGGRALWVQKF